MISYTTIGRTNFEQSKKFFDATLGALNYTMLHDYSEHGTVAYGDPKQTEQANATKLWVMKTQFNGESASAGNGRSSRPHSCSGRCVSRRCAGKRWTL